MTRRIKFGIALIAILAIAAYLYAGRLGSTPPFRDSAGIVVPGSVATMERMNLGGVEQSVTIRGRNAKAPILIWLHGGPGMDATGMWRFHNATLEDHFVVVYWTQRGTGRSYSSDIPIKSMTRGQFVADLDQLIGTLKRRFGQNKVVVAGHSWGTSIGVAYVQAHPENVSAYVGIGQIANAAEGERRSYAYTVAEAKKRGNAEALADLTKIGPPPFPTESMLIQRGWLEKFGGAWHKPTSLIQLMLTSYKASEMTWYDGVKFNAGMDFSLRRLGPEIDRVDWMATAKHFAIPVFIVAGRYDRNTDADLAHEYFDKIEAPAKQFKWFEQSAHSPPFEEPAAFNAFMINDVLPVAIKTQQGNVGR
jgi:pimeloyl-ACP methyl ester carboxylesterase